MSETSLWDRIYASGGAHLTLTRWPYSFNRLREIILNVLKDIENPFIVSEGCGEGNVEIEIARSRKDSILIGIDHSSVAVAHAQQLAWDAEVYNVFFIKGLIEDYLNRKNFYNRDLSLGINSYQYFINRPGERNTKMLKMFRSLIDNVREGGYMLLTGPSLEGPNGFGESIVPELIDYTEPLACYRVMDDKGNIMHQETLLGKKFIEAVKSEKFNDVELVSYGRLPFDARDLFSIADLAERMGYLSIANRFKERGKYYKEIQKDNPSEGPMLDWYLFQKLF